MDILSEITIAIQLDSFKNIDLARQGFYQIRIRISYEVNNETHFAEPIKLWENPRKPVKKYSKITLPSQIIDSSRSYVTKGFLVRYHEELVSLGEICEFSCKVPLSSINTLKLKICTDLYFSAFTRKKEEKQNKNDIIASLVLEKIKSREYMVSCINSTNFLQMSFDPDYFCFVKCLVHTYTIRLCNLTSSLKEYYFGNSLFVGGKKVDKAYLSIVDPLFISYNAILREFTRLAIDGIISDTEIPPNLVLPLINPLKAPSSFYEVVKSHDPVEILNSLLAELTTFSESIVSCLNSLIFKCVKSSAKVISSMKPMFYKDIWKRYQEFICLTTRPSESSDSTRLRNSEIAKEIRLSPYYKHLEPPALVSDDYLDSGKCHPIFFIETSNVELLKYIDEFPVKSRIHLVVLVHGYRGTSLDMQLLEDYIDLIFPSVYVLSSRANENDSDTDLKIQGQRLASEVISFLTDNKVPNHRLKLSFIGHSMGGLVIRAALPLLSEYKESFFAYVSLSSPHTGVAYSDNVIISIGKWILGKIQNSEAFNQMKLKDFKKIEETYLFELSKSEGLAWFQHILLFSCHNDPYVTADSANIFVPNDCIGSKKEKHFQMMVKQILENVDQDRIVRVTVDFKNKELLDDYMCTGNRHLDFLINSWFVKMLIFAFPKLFIE